MSAADDRQIKIAVALFEKGYAPDDVETALKSCNSHSAALKWLRSAGASVAANRPRVSQTPKKQSITSRSAVQGGSISSRQPATPQRGSAAKAPRVSSPGRQPATPQRGSAAKAPRVSSPGPHMSGQEETCQICFDEVPAGAATRLGCRHGFYCIDCLRRHTEARIAAGQIDVPCPECTTKVQERDLRRLLPPALVERLLSRSLERAVSSITDLRACPTPNCPMRVVVGEDESGWMSCPTCRKQSCVHCGVQPYHRGLSCEEAAQRMRRGSAADVERQTRLFQQWMMKTGTKQCPQCRAPVSKQNLKSQGTQYAECHKMVCLNCSTRFCFKCCAILTDTYSCGCSSSLHGFINPTTGRRLEHFSRAAKAKAKAAEKSKAKEKAAKAGVRAKALTMRPAGKIRVIATQVGRAKKATVLAKAKVKVMAKHVGTPKTVKVSR